MFYSCKYTVDGQVEGEEQKSYTRTVAKGEEYQTFSANDDDLRKWMFLEITVEKL